MNETSNEERPNQTSGPVRAGLLYTRARPAGRVARIVQFPPCRIPVALAFLMPNSGSPYEGLIVLRITGPARLTGGTFGIEASYVAILLCLVAGVALVVRARRLGQLVPLRKV